ncbi:universal stress protein [Mucilaginibacter psychrotolerans]|uniref:Universal stress protein n=1 Tax=Mucilaginibacter psychrotolerans TaxID=1524096 RepID=A0A4Y8SJE9_9SPHI|nr:universal stress protein [Mucilaginibacter psychrotolerans]TFF38526.1 universal stress protein [Mucilaginibacter psychrotolerans]
MKTILISTDFSPVAAHAAVYGYNLAKQTKANILLAHAITVPAEVPQSGMIVWPMYESEEMSNDSKAELQKLKKHLEENDYSDTFKPAVSYRAEAGKVTDVIAHLADEEISMIITGSHSSDGLSTFLLGNHCSNLIDTATKPLLIVPAKAAVRKIKKIAFATDFNQVGKDTKSIYKLIEFAKLMGADILLTHIYTDDHHSPALQLLIDQLMTELSNKANYPQIYYRALKDSKVEKGLTWLCENDQIDILAMNHGPYNFIDDILKLSHTKKMAAHIAIPLLVYQAT